MVVGARDGHEISQMALKSQLLLLVLLYLAAAEAQGCPEEPAQPDFYVLDFYQVLDIQRNTSRADIKKAFRKQSLLWHPDKQHVDAEFARAMWQEIQQAYEVLVDDDLRKDYDRCGLPGLKPSSFVSKRICFFSLFFTQIAHISTIIETRITHINGDLLNTHIKYSCHVALMSCV